MVALQVAVPNHVGDAVMALGPLRQLGAAFPSIRLVGRPAAARVLDGQGPWGSVQPTWERGGAAVLLAPSLRVALQAVASRARPRIGAPTDARRLLLTDIVDITDVVHYRDALQRVAAAALSRLGAPRGAAGSERLQPDPAGRLWWESVGRPEVLLHPWAVGMDGAKRWPRERWIELGRRLGRVAVTAGPDAVEAEEAVAIAAALRAPVCAGASALSVRGWASAALAARLVVLPDTGLAHVASAAGAQPLVLFGPTDPARYAPRNAHVVRAGSMQEITVSRVLEAAGG